MSAGAEPRAGYIDAGIARKAETWRVNARALFNLPDDERDQLAARMNTPELWPAGMKVWRVEGPAFAGDFEFEQEAVPVTITRVAAPDEEAPIRFTWHDTLKRNDAVDQITFRTRAAYVLRPEFGGTLGVTL